jgi:lysophospholipase L1-like esterase
MKKLLSKIEKDSKLVLATSTVVYTEGNKRLNGAWMKRVKERNEAMQELATEKGYKIDDLYAVSTSISKEYRCVDGTHYLADGYTVLAKAVAECVRNELAK